MVDRSRLNQALRRFVRILTGRYDIGDVLYELTDWTVEVLECAGAGVAVRNEDGLKFVTASEEEITRIEERQVVAGEGPCHDAFHSREVVVCPDLEAESRWPAYREMALEQGARAVAGIPLVAGDEALGALNVYWTTPHDPTGAELDTARLLAQMAAGYISNLVVLEDAERLAKQLQHALDTRVAIEQAKGVIAERAGIEPGAAFEVIRGYARPRQRRVLEVAREIVSGELEPS